MMPISQAIIGDIFPPAQRAKLDRRAHERLRPGHHHRPAARRLDHRQQPRLALDLLRQPAGGHRRPRLRRLVALPGHVSLRKHRLDYEGSALLVAAAVPLLLG
jgi:hypothetical protein